VAIRTKTFLKICTYTNKQARTKHSDVAVNTINDHHSSVVSTDLHGDCQHVRLIHKTFTPRDISFKHAPLVTSCQLKNTEALNLPKVVTSAVFSTIIVGRSSTLELGQSTVVVVNQ